MLYLRPLLCHKNEKQVIIGLIALLVDGGMYVQIYFTYFMILKLHSRYLFKTFYSSQICYL